METLLLMRIWCFWHNWLIMCASHYRNLPGWWDNTRWSYRLHTYPGLWFGTGHHCCIWETFPSCCRGRKWSGCWRYKPGWPYGANEISLNLNRRWLWLCSKLKCGWCWVNAINCHYTSDAFEHWFCFEGWIPHCHEKPCWCNTPKC